LTRSIPKVYVTRFFQLITTRQFAEAERVLERVKQKMQMSERNRGYFQALYGMFLAHRSNNDRYAFLSNLSPKDRKEFQALRRDFSRQSEHRLHADYDRGFFSAWADFMRILPKLEELTNVSLSNTNRVEKQAELTVAEPEMKTEESDETKTEPKEAAMEEVKEAESVGKTEPRQSTLVDFSKK